MAKEFTSRSVEETLRIGQELAREFPPDTVVCFFGDLGAGKTTLIKGIVSELASCSPDAVSSPTFVYLNRYEGEKPAFHFDLYRLADSDSFIEMGFDEMFEASGVCCIEWPERIAAILPENAVRITLLHVDAHTRQIRIEGL